MQCRRARTLSRCASRAVTTLRPSGDRLNSRPPPKKGFAPSTTCVSTDGRCQLRGAADSWPAWSGVSKTRGDPCCCWCVMGNSLHGKGQSTRASPTMVLPKGKPMLLTGLTWQGVSQSVVCLWLGATRCQAWRCWCPAGLGGRSRSVCSAAVSRTRYGSCDARGPLQPDRASRHQQAGLLGAPTLTQPRLGYAPVSTRREQRVTMKSRRVTSALWLLT